MYGLVELKELSLDIPLLYGDAQAAATAVTISAAPIDLQAYDMYQEAELVLTTGAATGTPDSFTVDLKVQDSPDNNSDYVDMKDVAGNVIAITQITANSKQAKLNWAPGSYNRYLKPILKLAFVNGTSPKLPLTLTLKLFKQATLN